MNKEKIYELMQLSIWGELSPEEEKSLKSAIENDPQLKSEYESMKSFDTLISQKKNSTHEDELLQEARQQLKIALQIERTKKTFFEELSDRFNFFIKPSYAFAFGAVALLLLGIFIGSRLNTNAKPEELFVENSIDNPELSNNPLLVLASDTKTPALSKDVAVSNIKFIDSDASDGQVEFVCDVIKPMHIKGSIEDEQIQKILVRSMLSEQNPDIRRKSVNAIGENKPIFQDNEIKSAIINVVKYDENPGVRLEAIKKLQRFPMDESIKNLYIHVLTTDNNSGLRIEAMNSLMLAIQHSDSTDDEILTLFKDKLSKDDNNYIRVRATSLLEGKTK